MAEQENRTGRRGALFSDQKKALPPEVCHKKKTNFQKKTKGSNLRTPNCAPRKGHDTKGPQIPIKTLVHVLRFGNARWRSKCVAAPWKEEEEERGGRKEEGKERKAGSGAQPREIFLKTRFYPLSGPRWGLSFAFLDSSHRDLPFGETPTPGGRLDTKIRL